MALRETLGLSSSWTGEGVGIAIIDSGVAASEDFGSRLTASYDFTTDYANSRTVDDYGHGTHVSGLAAGEGKGEEIPLGARILAVVDCFDALTSDRPYRARLPVGVALQILRDRRGQMYDPRIVDEFIELVQMSAIDLPAHDSIHVRSPDTSDTTKSPSAN